MNVRVADPSDIPLLTELGAETFFDAFAADNTPENMAAYLAEAFSPEKQAAELADPGSRFLIAEVDGVPAGYARLTFGPAPPAVRGETPMQIVRFYARHEWIGKGVGAGLMVACIEEAASRRCDVIWLSVWDRNPRGIAFYRKWGFEQVGTTGFRVGDDLQTDFLMARKSD